MDSGSKLPPEPSASFFAFDAGTFWGLALRKKQMVGKCGWKYEGERKRMDQTPIHHKQRNASHQQGTYEPKIDHHRLSLIDLRKKTSNAALVSSADLGKKKLHYDSADYRALGKRYAEVFLKMEAK